MAKSRGHSPTSPTPAAAHSSRTRRVRPTLVHQFLVVLIGADPVVWRRIQVPETYSFCDLHVAIQDAMGWLDYHLHEFRLVDADEQAMVSIGIPTDEDLEDRPVVPGWDVRVSKYFDPRAWHAPPATEAMGEGFRAITESVVIVTPSGA